MLIARRRSILLVVAVSAAFLAARGHSRCQTPPPPGIGADVDAYTISGVPVLSGTNSKVNVWAYTYSWTGLDRVDLKINGTLISLDCGDGGAMSGAWTITLDSTNFSDGSIVEFVVDAYDGAGNHAHKVTDRAVYNKAFVYGNDRQDGGSLAHGVLATGYATSGFQGAKYDVDPARDQNGTDQCMQGKSDILNSIDATYCMTALYGYTHGEPGLYGDSYAVVTYDVNHWISSAEVSSRVSLRSSLRPPVCFVFLDACSVGSTTGLSNAFGLCDCSDTVDRAFIGWTSEAGTWSSDVDWTGRLFDDLNEGWELQSAIALANTPPATDGNGNAIVMGVHGDVHFKLHGVYGVNPSLDWLR